MVGLVWSQPYSPNLLLTFRRRQFMRDGRARRRLAGHVICWHRSICILLGCGGGGAGCWCRSRVLVVDKSLALIEAGRPMVRACCVVGLDSVAETLSCIQLTYAAAHWWAARYITVTLHRRPVYVLSRPDRPALRSVLLGVYTAPNTWSTPPTMLLRLVAYSVILLWPKLWSSKQLE